MCLGCPAFSRAIRAAVAPHLQRVPALVTCEPHGDGTPHAVVRGVRQSLLLLGILAACDHPDPPATTVRARPDDLAAEIQAADQRIPARFGAARQIEYGLARSDLESARTNAHVIAQLDEPALAKVWLPYMIGVRNAARQIEIAGDVTLAAT